jgi:hypothetical protein
MDLFCMMSGQHGAWVVLPPRERCFQGIRLCGPLTYYGHYDKGKVPVFLLYLDSHALDIHVTVGVYQHMQNTGKQK